MLRLLKIEQLLVWCDLENVGEGTRRVWGDAMWEWHREVPLHFAVVCLRVSLGNYAEARLVRSCSKH